MPAWRNIGQVELTVVLYLLVVLDRLPWLLASVNVLRAHGFPGHND